MRALNLLAVSFFVLAGCALRPAGEPEERDRAASAGRAWIEPVEVPPLPDDPTAEDWLRIAFLANAGLQERYWEWRSAIERIPQEASFPNVAVPFRYMFSSEKMKAWDRTTLGIMNDPMSNIPYPGKVSAAGRRALEEARAAGLRFEAAKFELQGRVLNAWYDLALAAELARLQKEETSLLQTDAARAGGGVRSGAASRQEQLAAQTALDLAENESANLGLEAHHAGVRLNRLAGRPAEAPVPAPAGLPSARGLPVSDADLLRTGSERSPELQALAREIGGRKEALDLARMAWIPDFGLSFENTGSASRMLGGMLALPTRIEAIRGGIAQAEADLKAAEAGRTQYGRDLAASFVLNLYVLRNAERQAQLFDGTILPRARETVELARAGFTAGRAGFGDLLDAQRALVQARRALARLRIERERAVAAIETWSAVDVEVMRPEAGAMGGAMRGGGAAKPMGGRRGGAGGSSTRDGMGPAMR